MSLDIRKIEEEDYDILVKWWKDWGWEAPPREFLPENGTGGFIVLSNDLPVCAGFMYITNSKVGWSEFIISSKEYKGGDRSAAIDLLMEGMTSFFKKVGCKYVFTSVKNKALQSRYKKHGYTVNDESVEMTKVL